MPIVETANCFVSYRDGPETERILYDRILEFFKKHEAFNGESVMQNDGPQLEAGELLADIAEEIFHFSTHYK